MSNPVAISETEIPGVLVIKTGVFYDERGFFTEAYSQDGWQNQGFSEAFIQDNLSMSVNGTLRGMHYQLSGHGIGKLVRVISGAYSDG